MSEVQLTSCSQKETGPSVPRREEEEEVVDGRALRSMLLRMMVQPLDPNPNIRKNEVTGFLETGNLNPWVLAPKEHQHAPGVVLRGRGGGS